MRHRPDGTCIRYRVHVSDPADAHVAALGNDRAFSLAESDGSLGEDRDVRWRLANRPLSGARLPNPA
jgi:hypothetical protein